MTNRDVVVEVRLGSAMVRNALVGPKGGALAVCFVASSDLSAVLDGVAWHLSRNIPIITA